MLRRPGSSWGFGALLKGTSVVVLKVERAMYIHSPHLQFLPARDSNSQPLGYETDSLTIRPRLPLKKFKVWSNSAHSIFRNITSADSSAMWSTTRGRTQHVLSRSIMNHYWFLAVSPVWLLSDQILLNTLQIYKYNKCMHHNAQFTT